MNTLAYETPEWLNEIDVEDPALPWEESAASLLPPQGESAGARDAVEQWIVTCAKLAKDYELQQEALEAHIKELTAKKKRKEIAVNLLRELASREMIKRNWSKIKTPLCTLSVSKEGQSLQLVNAAEVPDEFVKIERTPRVADAQKHFKATGEIPDGFDVLPTVPKFTIRWS